MYNLIIGYTGPTDKKNEVTVCASRYLEYTDSETQMRYRNIILDPLLNEIDSLSLRREIKSFPALFMQEHCSDGAFIASIKSITRDARDYKITFERDSGFEVISPQEIKKLTLELGIENFEFYRTHWAIKNIDLFSIFSKKGDVAEHTPELIESAAENIPAVDGSNFNEKQVFIVHGHDEHAKNDVKNYVKSKDLKPIILHLEASGGKTIIEKIDHYSKTVGFAIVLYTECDVGAKKNTLDYKWRARQNVVFEHGYLIAKLSRQRVVALVKGDVETPNDTNGIVYVVMDPPGNWKDKLDAELNELKSVGYGI